MAKTRRKTNTLSDESIELLRHILEEYDSQPPDPPIGFFPGMGGAGDEDHLAPQVYIAKTPIGGIPALDIHTTGTAPRADIDDQPGQAECEIYRIISQTGGVDATGTGGVVDVLVPVDDLTYTVYNLSQCDIDGDIWILVVRDIWGSWIAVSKECAQECPSPGWDECAKRVVDVRVECVAGEIITEVDVEYDRLCNGVRVSTSNSPCAIRIIISGVTDNACDNCAVINSTFSITQTSATSWEYISDDVVCSSTTPGTLAIFITLVGDELIVRITQDAGGGNYSNLAVYYTAFAAGWDGSTLISLDLAANDDGCSGWPSTIVIQP